MALRYDGGRGEGGGGEDGSADQTPDELDSSLLVVAAGGGGGGACNRSYPFFPSVRRVAGAPWSGFPGSDGCASTPYVVELNQFTVPIYGYISPLFVLLTIVTNCLVCLVLVRRSMRTPTNTILVAMAISDTLTGTLPIPCFVYFYALRHYDDYVLYEWCFAYHCLTDYVPTIFHTASIWLTVALAAQRYVYVRRTTDGKRLCTIANIVKVIVAVYLCAVASQLCRFVEYQYFPVSVRVVDDQKGIVAAGSETTEAVVYRTACQYDFSPLIYRYQHLYFNLYYWFRVVFIHFVPCASLVLLNSALILAMRSAQKRRGALLLHSTTATATATTSGGGGGGGCGDCAARSIENNSTTLMLVTVVGVTLLVELPLAFLLIVNITENTFDVELLDQGTSYSASLFLNMFTLISYPLNFFIYCGMSHQFRRTFRGLFSRESPAGPAGHHQIDHQKYHSIAPPTPPAAKASRLPRSGAATDTLL